MSCSRTAARSPEFNKDKRTISDHVSNIFKDDELNENSVVRNFRSTTRHGAIADKTQQIEVNAQMPGFRQFPPFYTRPGELAAGVVHCTEKECSQ